MLIRAGASDLISGRGQLPRPSYRQKLWWLILSGYRLVGHGFAFQVAYEEVHESLAPAPSREPGSVRTFRKQPARVGEANVVFQLPLVHAKGALLLSIRDIEISQ